MDTLTIHRDAVRLAGDAATRADTHGNVPSACLGWTVADVVRHMIHVQTTEVLGEPIESVEGEDDLAAVLDEALLPTWRALIERLPGPAAADPEMLYFPALDLLMHAWDIRHGLSREGLAEPLEFPDELLAWVEDFQSTAPEERIRQPGIFGPAQDAPDDATRTERFMAWAGRRLR